MSVHQMLCHVADAFLMATGEKPVKSHATYLGRTLLKWGALYAPFRWPGGIPTCRELDQEGEGTRPADFAADLVRAEILLRAISRDTSDLGRQDHPTFGPMTRADWLRWGFLHTDHHLRQFGV